MATSFLFVRHAETDHIGRVLTGRAPGVHLSPAERRAAYSLAATLREFAVTAVQSSPRERARQTAEPIAASLGLPCETVAALDEIDFGDWQGKSFEDLAADPRWQRWNTARATTTPPGGESMEAAQARIIGHLRALCASHPEQCLVLVSHADLIKAALLHVMGASLDAHGQIEVEPASVSQVVLWDGGGKLVGLNQKIAA